jgi:para-aminobenzoate synthetase / 4-amino-4-deoxychorismate lyase
MSCFALLDDCNATEADPRSRLYSGYLGEHCCTHPTDLEACWQRVRSCLQQKPDLGKGCYAVVLMDYDWATQHLARPQTDQNQARLRFLMFERCEKKSKHQIDEWLNQKCAADFEKNKYPAQLIDFKPTMDASHYQTAIERIQAWIRQGQTYQINYTYRCRGWAQGSPFALYQHLRQTQPVPFGALLALPDSTSTPQHQNWILSFSPELFVQHHQGELSARPMKGTAPRSVDLAQDAQNADWLRHNEKNRAENLMIVDLLRNDLGQIAKLGSVQVPELFSIEPYATLHQMTSTVTAQLKKGLDVPDVLRALFPCGSITGAPKHHTMALINEIESAPRGLYTGAMGWIDPIDDLKECPSFCWSVVIRTLLLGTENAEGLRAVEMGVGSGIVADSLAADEYQETLLKTQFLIK